MTRFAAILLALSLAAGGALAASPEAAYLAARDKAIAEVKALEAAKASESAINAAQDRALADLTKRLKEVVGPVSVKGFPPPDQLNIALSVYQQGYGSLDGLFSYGKANQALLVTTRALAYGVARSEGEGGRQRVPPAPGRSAPRPGLLHLFNQLRRRLFEVLRSAGNEADRRRSRRRGVRRLRAGDGPLAPDAIVATVVKSDRVFVAEIPPRHDKLAFAICCSANDRRELIGEDTREQRQVAHVVMPSPKPIADRRLSFGEAVEIAQRSSITFESGPLPLLPGEAIDEGLRLLGQAGQEALLRRAGVEAGAIVSVGSLFGIRSRAFCFRPESLAGGDFAERLAVRRSSATSS
jgi:hypothetical protein